MSTNRTCEQGCNGCEACTDYNVDDALAATAPQADAPEAAVWMDAGHLREVLNGNDMPAYCQAGPADRLVPLYTRAQPAPQALGAATVEPGDLRDAEELIREAKTMLSQAVTNADKPGMWKRDVNGAAHRLAAALSALEPATTVGGAGAAKEIARVVAALESSRPTHAQPAPQALGAAEVWHAVLSPSGLEGVIFKDRADADWTAAKQPSNRYDAPTIGCNFRECYDHAEKFTTVVLAAATTGWQS